MTTTLFQLMTALVHWSALHAAGFKAVLAVEREDAMRYNNIQLTDAAEPHSVQRLVVFSVCATPSGSPHKAPASRTA